MAYSNIRKNQATFFNMAYSNIRKNQATFFKPLDEIPSS